MLGPGRKCPISAKIEGIKKGHTSRHLFSFSHGSVVFVEALLWTTFSETEFDKEKGKSAKKENRFFLTNLENRVIVAEVEVSE